MERALDLTGPTACVVIGEEVSDANLRWANNTLTTNGLTRGNQLTVIAVSGGAVGVVSRSGVTLDSLESLVRAAEQTARTGPEAEDAGAAGGGRPPAARRLGRPARQTGVRVFGRFAAELGEAFGRASGAGRAPVRLCGARAAHHLCRLVHRVCEPATTNRPATWRSTPSPPTSAGPPGRAWPPPTSPTSTWSR